VQQGNFRPNSGGGWRQDPLGVSAPMGASGGEKELMRPGKNPIETHVRSRFDEKSSFLLMLIYQIGQGTKVIDDFVQNMGVASQPIDGLPRAEYIMFGSNMISSESLPFGLGRGRPGNGNKRSVWNKPKQGSNESE